MCSSDLQREVPADPRIQDAPVSCIRSSPEPNHHHHSGRPSDHHLGTARQGRLGTATTAAKHWQNAEAYYPRQPRVGAARQDGSDHHVRHTGCLGRRSGPHLLAPQSVFRQRPDHKFATACSSYWNLHSLHDSLPEEKKLHGRGILLRHLRQST